MGLQPIRNKIKESHPSLTQTPIYTLLVDGHNILKVSMSDPKVNGNGQHVGGIFQFLLQLKIMLSKKDFDYVYVFWDGDNSGQLRYDIYPEYKANRDKNYAESDYDKYINDYVKRSIQYSKQKKKEQNPEKIKEKEEERETFEREKLQIQLILEELFIRQLSINEIEGDDLIAYYTNHKKDNEKIVIMSGDRDLSQLINSDVCLYIPTMKTFLTADNHKEVMGYHVGNVLLKKIICGDSSDNIKGIKGIGEDTLFKLFPELKERKVDLEEILEHSKQLVDERVKSKKAPLKRVLNIINRVTDGVQGEDIFEINDKIINLKKPILNDTAIKEMESLSYAPIDPENRTFTNAYNIILENDIIDLKEPDRFSTFFSTYNRIINKEKKRYETND